jgi:hypothetical protein
MALLSPEFGDHDLLARIAFPPVEIVSDANCQTSEVMQVVEDSLEAREYLKTSIPN